MKNVCRRIPFGFIAVVAVLLIAVIYAPTVVRMQSFTMTTVSGVKLLNVDKTPLNGTITITLTDANDNPVTYTPQGGSPSSAPFTANVVKGAIQPVSGFPFAIPAAATTTPTGILYRIVTANSSSTVVWTLPKTPIISAGYSIDGYIAQAGLPISGTGTPTLPFCAPGAQYTDTTAPTIAYACSRLPDGTVLWTQNPSQNPQCTGQAIAYPATGVPYCVPPTQAYLPTGYVLGNTGASPAPATGVPASSGGTLTGVTPQNGLNGGGTSGNIPMGCNNAVAGTFGCTSPDGISLQGNVVSGNSVTSAVQQEQRASMARLSGLTGPITGYTATAPLVWHAGGNSLVQTDTGTITNFGPGGLIETTMKGSPYRIATSAQSTNGIVTVTIPNADGFFQIGRGYTMAYNPAFDSGCLADTIYPIAPTNATTVTFSTVQGTNSGPWPGQCADIGATAYPGIFTGSFVKHGINGITLAGWITSPSAFYGFAGMQAGIQSDITAARQPVAILTDACLATNSLRNSTLPVSVFETQCKGMVDQLEKTGAIGPDGYKSMANYTIIAETSTPYAAIWTIGGTSSGAPSDSLGTPISGQPQYICTAGGPQLTGTCSDPFSAPVAQSAAVVGANLTTLNFCESSLLPDIISPTDFFQSTPSGLYKDGTPIMVQLDTVGSGVQEWVQLTSITFAAGPTVNGFPPCTIGYVAANAHTSGFQVVTGNNTATQILSSVRRDIAKDMTRWYPNIKLSDNQVQFGYQVNQPNGYIQNQLHPAAQGYALDHQPTFKMLQNVNSSRDSSPAQPQITTADTKELVNSVQSTIDPRFDSMAASLARLQTSLINPTGSYALSCLDDQYFYTVAQYPALAGGAGSGFARVASTNTFTTAFTLKEAQTGDSFYNFYTGCSQPITITSTQQNSSGSLQINFTGGTNMGTAGPNGGQISGPVIIRRPRYVSSAAVTYQHEHPFVFQQNWVVTIAAGSGLNSLVFTVDGTQPDGTISAPCSNVSLQAGDYGAVGNAAQTTIAFGPGSFSGAGSTCTWTDSSGTNYSSMIGSKMNLFGTNRSRDGNFTNLGVVNSTAIGSQSVTGFNTNGTPTPPPITVVTSGGTTGGNLSDGTYCYEISYLPANHVATPLLDGIAIGTAPGAGWCGTLSGHTTTQQASVRYAAAPPAGQTVNIYGRAATSSGPFLLIDNSGPTASSYVDKGFITPTGAAGTTDRSVTSNGLYGPTQPTAASQIPCSIAPGSSAVTWIGCPSSGAGTTTNPVTFNNSGSGAASGTAFNGSAPVAVSYNTLGAAPSANIALSALAAQIADSWVANATGGSAAPSAIAIPNCSTGITYSTSTHTFGCAAGGGTGTVTNTAGALTAGHFMEGNGGADSKVDNGSTTDGAGNVNFQSVTTNGTTPGQFGLAAGTGNIPALAANSAGFAAPVTGGTPYRFKLPATATAGILHAATPATGDGVLESAVTVSAVNLASGDVTGLLPNANLANPSLTVNGVTCSLGGTCTIVAGSTWDTIPNPVGPQSLNMSTFATTWTWGSPAIASGASLLLITDGASTCVSGTCYLAMIKSGTTSAVHPLCVWAGPAGGCAIDISNFGQVNLKSTIVNGNFTSNTYATGSICTSTASPAVCGANVSGVVQVAAAATSLVIDSTAFTANTGCWFTYDVGGITAPTNMGSLLSPYISARTAGTSITITLPVAPATNLVKIQFGCMN